MKKYIITSRLVAGLGTTIIGCRDYLDSDYIFDKRMSIEQAFQNEDHINEWLARGCTYLKHDYLQQVNNKRNTPFNFANDMYYGDSNYVDWKSGNYTEKGLGTGNSLYIWQSAYQGIRHLPVFLNNIDMNKEFSEPEIADMKGQTYFLRAYCYWMLIRSFGPTPTLPDEGIDYTKEYDEIAYPRNSYDECVDYISNELVKATMLLEKTRGPQDIVCPARGTALSLRSRVLLYAASPLFNGKVPTEVIAALVDESGKKLLSDTYDERKWAIAAAAAKDVIELGKYQLHVTYKSEGGSGLSDPVAIILPDDEGTFHSNPWPKGWQNIDPFKSYRALFGGEVPAYGNSGIVFTRGTNQGAENIEVMVIHQLSRSQGGGYNRHGMTQKQCDVYYMRDGSDCPGMDPMYAGMEGYADPSRYDNDPRPTEVATKDELSKYPELRAKRVGISKQHAGREPRFYASVAYNGSVWHMSNADINQKEEKDVQIFYHGGGSDGYKIGTNWLNTDTGIKKFVHPNDLSDADKAYNASRIETKYAPDVRYAEILLDHAEALNEVQGTYEVSSWNREKMHTITHTTEELKRGVQPIRIRVGLPDYDVYDSPDKFRIKIKRERQIELFVEGYRFFDIRRWCDAPVEESVPMYRCDIYISKEDSTGLHTPVETTSVPTMFSTKMWFWPIYHYIMKRNLLMTQNPGWRGPE